MIITPVDKYLYKTKRMAVGLIFGIIFAIDVCQAKADVSGPTFKMIANIGVLGLLLVLCMFFDQKEFIETKKIKSYISTIVLLSVIILDLGFYFYWV